MCTAGAAAGCSDHNYSRMVIKIKGKFLVLLGKDWKQTGRESQGTPLKPSNEEFKAGRSGLLRARHRQATRTQLEMKAKPAVILKERFFHELLHFFLISMFSALSIY